MKLTSVTVQSFRNFVQAQTVKIEPDMTVLVGKNEAGKTTLLKALHRLNPANLTDVSFDLTTEYPRWRLSRDRKANASLVHNTVPVRAWFELDAEDIAAVSEHLPVAPPVGALCVASRNYENTLFIGISTSLDTVVRACASAAEVTSEDLKPLLGANNLASAVQLAKDAAKELKTDPDKAPRAKALTELCELLREIRIPSRSRRARGRRRQCPDRSASKVFLFRNTSLPGECDLTELSAKIANGEPIGPRQRTVLALLAHAGEKPSDFLDENYDSRKAELQAASLDLSRHVFEYWQQNTDLSVVFDTDNPQHEDGTHHRLLKIEIGTPATGTSRPTS